MSPQSTKSARNLLQLSSEWIYYPLDLQLKIAGRVARKVYNRMSRPKKTLITLVLAGGLAAILALSLIHIAELDADAIVWGAWMFLLGALLVLLVVIFTDRR